MEDAGGSLAALGVPNTPDGQGSGSMCAVAATEVVVLRREDAGVQGPAAVELKAEAGVPLVQGSAPARQPAAPPAPAAAAVAPQPASAPEIGMQPLSQPAFLAAAAGFAPAAAGLGPAAVTPQPALQQSQQEQQQPPAMAADAAGASGARQPMTLGQAAATAQATGTAAAPPVAA